MVPRLGDEAGAAVDPARVELDGDLVIVRDGGDVDLGAVGLLVTVAVADEV